MSNTITPGSLTASLDFNYATDSYS